MPAYSTSPVMCALVIAIGLSAVATTRALAQTYPEEAVAKLQMSPEAITVQVGERAPVEITAVDDDGNALDDIMMRVTSRGSGAWYDPETSEVLGVVPGEELISARVRRSRRDGPGFDDVFGFIRVYVTPAPVDQLEIEPQPTLFVGTRTTLTATASAGGAPRNDVEPEWESFDPTILRVTPGGLAIGVTSGDARVTASVGNVAASLSMRVEQDPVRGLELEPDSQTVQVGDVIHLSVVATDDRGRNLRDLPTEWTLLPGSGHAHDRAFVDADGAFVAYEAGLHRVMASVGSHSAIAELVATPRAPRHAVRLVAHGVAPAGQSTTDLWVFEGQDGRDYAYTGTYSGNLMYAWDVTDPGQPVITDSLAFDGRRVNDVKINADASLAVVTSENAANRRNGITLLDIADPAHPTRITHFTDGLTGGVHNVWIEGDLVYAVHYGTADLHIVDISDPENPRRVGRWGLDKQNKWLHDVNIEDGLAYLSYWDDGVVILDVGNGVTGGTPTDPQFVAQHKYQYQLGNDGETYGNTHHAVRYGNYVFAGDEIFGCAECLNGPRGYIHVVDVSDVRRPVEVGYYRVPEAGAHNMWAEDDKLYIGYYQAGLRVLDISGELRGDLYRQGREIGWYMTEDAEGTTPNTTDTWGAQPHKGAVFASDPNSGLWIVELVPPEPRPVF
jgi:hypothetical protein